MINELMRERITFSLYNSLLFCIFNLENNLDSDFILLFIIRKRKKLETFSKKTFLISYEIL